MLPKLMLLTCAAAMLAESTSFAQTAGAPLTFRRQFEELVRNSARASDSARLHRLFELDWEYAMHEYPEWATDLGRTGNEGRWTNNSITAIRRRQQERQWPLSVIRSIDRSGLSEADQLNYDLFRSDLEMDIEGDRFNGDYLAINQPGGVHQSVPRALGTMKTGTVAEYEHILSRLRAVPELIDHTIQRLELGLEAGITPPRITLRDVPGQVRSVITDDPMQSPLLRPFRQFPSSIPEPQRKRLREEAVRIYSEQVAASYETLHRYLAEKYVPNARVTIGMSSLPNGADWYEYRIRRSTTTKLTAREIHDIGLSEVARIRKEMEGIVRETGFNGTFAQFLEFLRTDPQFFYTDTTAFLQAYRDIAQRADPQLVTLFGRLPRLPYGVVATPAYMEKSSPTAYYYSGSLKAGRPGLFYANTYDLRSRPKWEMEALTLHEAVPGHHLQIALAQEMEEGPEFRKHQGYTAFVEGWGLYAESLGEEMGFYKDPYSKFGQLTYEMWRAIRLVVDTGIHAFGWSREQALEFFRENSSKSEHDIVVEVDRYIVWPGQALAYKIGELKIKELRRFARAELGDSFDIRAFHDLILGRGAVPLDVLEAEVKRWVAARK